MEHQIKYAVVLFFSLVIISIPQYHLVGATSLSVDYYQFRHAATYEFNVDFYGRPVYFPYWAQRHVWERHVLGYDMDRVYETTFYPLGQYVRGRHLPETMNGYEMVYLIEQTIEYGNVHFYGSRVVITYYVPHDEYIKFGISRMKVVIEREYYHGHLYYDVVTAYPVSGPAVAVYEGGHWAN